LRDSIGLRQFDPVRAGGQLFHSTLFQAPPNERTIHHKGCPGGLKNAGLVFCASSGMMGGLAVAFCHDFVFR